MASPGSRRPLTMPLAQKWAVRPVQMHSDSKKYSKCWLVKWCGPFFLVILSRVGLNVQLWSQRPRCLMVWYLDTSWYVQVLAWLHLASSVGRS